MNGDAVPVKGDMTQRECRVRAKMAANRALLPSLERALPARLFLSVAASFCRDGAAGVVEHELFAATAPALRQAVHEALGPDYNRPRNKGVSPLDLLNMVNDLLLAPYEARSRALALCMVVRFVNLLDGQYLFDLPETGPVRDAMEMMVGAMNDHQDLAADMDRSATKNAGRLLERCRALGLYLAEAGEVAA